MPNNDDCVVGLPNIQCPSCHSMLSVNVPRQFHKYTKEQRRAQKNGNALTEAHEAAEDRRSDSPEVTLVVTSCENTYCDQYNKIKVFRIPKIEASTAKVRLD